jgi:hypothetical protein
VDLPVPLRVAATRACYQRDEPTGRGAARLTEDWQWLGIHRPHELFNVGASRWEALGGLLGHRLLEELVERMTPLGCSAQSC